MIAALAGDRFGRRPVELRSRLQGKVGLSQQLPRLVLPRHEHGHGIVHLQPRSLHNASRSDTVIEVNARDRPGLLHDITFALTKQGLTIHNALVTTFGERAVDSFYVQDALGSKVTDKARLDRIRKRLIEAIEAPDDSKATRGKAA